MQYISAAAEQVRGRFSLRTGKVKDNYRREER